MRARGNQVYVAADDLLQALHIVVRFRWELLEVGDARGGAVPAGHLLVDGLAAFQRGQSAGELVHNIAVQFIMRAYLHRIEAVKHIEASEYGRSVAVHLDAVTRRHAVEPAHAPRPAGRYAKFLSEVADVFAGIVE